MIQDRDYFLRRAAEARAACSTEHGEMADVAGDLALAYTALARRHPAAEVELSAILLEDGAPL